MSPAFGIPSLENIFERVSLLNPEENTQNRRFPRIFLVDSLLVKDGPTSQATLPHNSYHSLFGLAYYSFSGVDARRTSLPSLLSSLIVQILNKDPHRFDRIRGLCRSLKKHTGWTEYALRRVFEAILATSGNVETFFVVIEDVHHCKSALASFFDGLRRIIRHEKSSTTVNIVLSSKQLDELRSSLKASGLNYEDGPGIVASSPLEENLARDIDRKSPQLKGFEAIIAELLKRCSSPSQRALALDALDVSGKDLTSCAIPFQSRIQELPFSNEEMSLRKLNTMPRWAQSALGWILYTKRPMKLDELALAITLPIPRADVFWEGSGTNSSDFHTDISLIIETAFGPLIEIHNSEVFFSHHEIRNSLFQLVSEARQIQDERQYEGTNKIGQGNRTSAESGDRTNHPLLNIPDDAAIALALLGYLSSPGLIKWAPSDLDYNMIGYAVEHWPSHYRDAEIRGSETTEIFKFIQSKQFITNWSHLRSRATSVAFTIDFGVEEDELFLASHLGLNRKVEQIMKNGIQNDQSREGITISRCDTAISLASLEGHSAVVKTLLCSRGHDVSDRLLLALKLASLRGYYQIVELLINHMDDFQESSAQQPHFLCHSAELGHEDQIELFITNGSDVNALDDDVSPLQLAAKNGLANIVSLLLEKGADVNTPQAKNTSKAILQAVSGGHSLVVNHLLTPEVHLTAADKEHRTPLHLAAYGGHENILRHLLDFRKHDTKEVVDIDVKDDNGCSPLMLASKRGHKGVVELLLQRGANLYSTDRSNHTALYHAVHQHHRLTAEALFKHAASSPVYENLRSVLLVDIKEMILEAAKAGFRAITLACIKRALHGCTPRESEAFIRLNKDSQGRTPLHHAAGNGRKEVVPVLVQKGYEIETKDNEGNTPLVLAAIAGSPEVVELLIGDRHSFETAQYIYERIVLPMVKTPSRWSSSRNAEVFRVVLQAIKPFDVLSSPHNCLAAIHDAVSRDDPMIVGALIRFGANPHSMVFTTAHQWGRERMSYQGWNPLHFSAYYGTPSVARLLLSAGVDPFRTDGYGFVMDDDDVVDPLAHGCGLLRGPTNKWLIGGEGLLPVHIAARYANIGVLEVFRTIDPALLHYVSSWGTPLHFAIYNRYCTKWFLDHGAQVDVQDGLGRTPLMRAAQVGNPDVVELLLQHQANAKARTKFGYTAFHYAVTSGNLKVVRLFIDHDITVLSDKTDGEDYALHRALTSFRNRPYRPDVARVILDYRDRIDIGLNSRGAHGDTPLLRSIERNDLGFTRHLIKCGADPNVRNNRGKIAFQVAIKLRTSDDGNRRHQAWMALVGPDNDIIDRASVAGGTCPSALYFAATELFRREVKPLLNRGADVNDEGGPYGTTLCAAAVGDIYNGCIGILLKHGADRHKRGGVFANALIGSMLSWSYMSRELWDETAATETDDQGRTGLHIAAWSGDRSGFDKFKQYCDLNARDKQGRTVIHYLAFSRIGHFDKQRILSDLLNDEQGRKLNVEDVDGWTPFHWACRLDKWGTAQILYQHNNADLYKKTKDGWTPYNIAMTHGHEEFLYNFRDFQNHDKRSWKQYKTITSLDIVRSCRGCFYRVSSEYLFRSVLFDPMIKLY